VICRGDIARKLTQLLSRRTQPSKKKLQAI